eukprot:4253517-Lingulodinium_polyedra.AAC.1
MECVNVRLASRRDCGTSIRPRHRATCVKRRAMTRSDRRFAVATTRKLHVRTLHARTENRPGA